MASGISAGALAGLSALSSVLSFGGNLATSAINSSRAWKYTRRAMDYQDNLNRAYTHDSYGIMRKGLEDANYNPLLALGSGANSAIYNGSSINSDSDNGSQAVENGINSALALQDLKIKQAQAENVTLNNDVIKYGKTGAKIKNLAKLAKEYQSDPKIQKLVDAEIVKLNPSFSHSAIDSQFYRQHPTTFKVLKKLKNGDYRGALYEIKLRNQRISKELNNGHSSVDYLTRAKNWDFKEHHPQFDYVPELDNKGYSDLLKIYERRH